MNKLRKYYTDLQADSKNNFDKITNERAKRLLAFTNQQYEAHIQQGQYSHLDQLAFYQDKFTNLQHLFKQSAGGKVKKAKLQSDIVQLISQNFGDAPTGVTPQQARKPSPPKAQIQKKESKKQQYKKQQQPPSRSQPQVGKNDPKQLLSSFFSKHRNEAEKKKVGFKSIMDTIPNVQPQKKYAVRSKIEMQKNNDEEIRKINGELYELKKRLQSQKEQKKFNQGLYDSEKKNYEVRIEDLLTQVQRLNIENQRIRQQVRAQQQNRYISSNPEPIVHQQHESVKRRDPHQIQYQENNLQKINQKNQNQYQFDHKSQCRSSHRQVPYSKASSQVKEYQHDKKDSEAQFIMKAFPQEKKQMPIKYNDYEASNIRFNRSEAENQDKNIQIRSKLSFFKQQIVLFRGHQIEVAVRSFDLIDLTSRKIYIFVNNKDKYDRQVQLTYDYDPSYYDLDVVRKLGEIQGKTQGKEEVHIRLKQKRDFDSMVQVKLNILHTTHKQIKFLLPTMFIEFTNQQPSRQHNKLYQKNFINPYHQFSSIYLAMEIIPFFKDYQQNIPVATIFARSKYHEGYITLRYKTKGEIEVETIAPWKLFISYLISREY